MADSSKIVNIIIAIILPPLAVYIVRGPGRDLLINIICCIFIWFPAILHALYVVLSDK